MSSTTINKTTLPIAVSELQAKSPVIAEIIRTYGSPPLWRREPGFASLVYTILEQQVSLASAKATYDKLLAAVDDLTPARFLEFDDVELRAVGFSRQKTEYCRILSHLIVANELRLNELSDKSDKHIRNVLMAIKGIGRWTADIYLLHSLGRPDVWPVGDLALRIAAKEVYDLEDRPSEDELMVIGNEFTPWRSVAARLFWHVYLSRRGIGEVT